ncbi:DUF6896 domain-containing protein [Simiduia aestuariiviva]|uniref:DUF6896 domain-containing protein n=1 Tax=Simiduia aestuariiviva TaxID=1510459 RepID=A0A839UX48_9GAMM|nr:hypothetical protein [Simiduia aestuariiviva]MBB3170028.1 hypothetical protein [Simiduia aestuariiviva]
MSNEELIKQLIPLWYAQRKWAEELLVQSFNLDKVEDLPRGRNPIPGTNWMYVTHGVGVDVYKTEEVGGIDFDFDKPDPDPWRLQILFEKQYNDGNLNYSACRQLFENKVLAKETIKRVLS